MAKLFKKTITEEKINWETGDVDQVTKDYYFRLTNTAAVQLAQVVSKFDATDAQTLGELLEFFTDVIALTYAERSGDSLKQSAETYAHAKGSEWANRLAFEWLADFDQSTNRSASFDEFMGGLAGDAWRKSLEAVHD